MLGNPPMVFALDMDDGTLLAFASAAEAVAHCKAVDVEDGYWRLYSEDGSPLEARYEPEDAALPRAYTLQRAMSGLWLQERLSKVATVRGCGLATIEDLVEILKVNRGRRAGPKRGSIA
jgi:hypothetical protein